MSSDNPPIRPFLAARLSNPVVQVTLAAIAAVLAIAVIAAFVLGRVGDDWAVLIGAVLTLAALQVPLAASLARRLRRRHREREAQLLREIDASRMQRRRIARQIHDGVAQELAATSFSVAALARRAEQVPGAESDALREIGARVRTSVRGLRGISGEIYPPPRNPVGLAAALDEIAAKLDAGGIAVALEIPEDVRLPATVEALFNRVAREALRNVLAHSGARAVGVRLVGDGGVATLIVEDDGRGFPPGVARGGGLGIVSELCRKAGARLRIASGAGGTRICVEAEVE